MVRRRLPCPVGNLSGELLDVGRKATVPDPRRLDILPLNDEVDLLFALGGP